MSHQIIAVYWVLLSYCVFIHHDYVTILLCRNGVPGTWRPWWIWYDLKFNIVTYQWHPTKFTDRLITLLYNIFVLHVLESSTPFTLSHVTFSSGLLNSNNNIQNNARNHYSSIMPAFWKTSRKYNWYTLIEHSPNTLFLHTISLQQSSLVEWSTFLFCFHWV